MTDTLTLTADGLVKQVDQLEADLQHHLDAVQAIRDTLDTLRKRLATATGARAGKHARSGKRRTRKQLLDEANPAPLQQAAS